MKSNIKPTMGYSTPDSLNSTGGMNSILPKDMTSFSVLWWWRAPFQSSSIGVHLAEIWCLPQLIYINFKLRKQWAYDWIKETWIILHKLCERFVTFLFFDSLFTVETCHKKSSYRFKVTLGEEFCRLSEASHFNDHNLKPVPDHRRGMQLTIHHVAMLHGSFTV